MTDNKAVSGTACETQRGPVDIRQLLDTYAESILNQEYADKTHRAEATKVALEWRDTVIKAFETAMKHEEIGRLLSAAQFAVEALAALTAYESEYGYQLPDDHEVGRIDESCGSASFRLRAGHIRMLAAAVAKARGRSRAAIAKEPPCSECGQPYIPNALREPVYKAVERILDEHSAWIARPSDKVTKAVAFAATVAAQQIVDQKESHFERAGSVMRAALETSYGELSVLVPGPRAQAPDFSMACPNAADAECVAAAYVAIRAAIAAAKTAGLGEK
jgi:hypothetical protein